MKDIWQRDEKGEIERPPDEHYGWGYLREEVFEEMQGRICMLGGILDRTVAGAAPAYTDGVYLTYQYNLDRAWPVARLYGRPVGWVGFLNDDGTLKPEDPHGHSLGLFKQ